MGLITLSDGDFFLKYDGEYYRLSYLEDGEWQGGTAVMADFSAGDPSSFSYHDHDFVLQGDYYEIYPALEEWTE